MAFAQSISGCPETLVMDMMQSREMQGWGVMAVWGLGPPLVPGWDQRCPQGTCLPAKPKF